MVFQTSLIAFILNILYLFENSISIEYKCLLIDSKQFTLEYK